MTKKRIFNNILSFKRSLEDRLKKVAFDQHLSINALRLKFLMERLLARLFASPNPPWLLKGGYAMELRYRPHARTTRDLDLGVEDFEFPAGANKFALIHDAIQTAAEHNLGDYLVYTVANNYSELKGAPDGGARFHCKVTIAGKLYGQFHIDVGFGDHTSEEPELLICEDFLAFAGLAPATVLAIPKSQQFAEKLHAYTFPWTGRINTRTKDLVDMILFIESKSLNPKTLLEATAVAFRQRDSHPLPIELPVPPSQWSQDFASMAIEVGISTTNLTDGFSVLNRYWKSIL